ncbi:MAG: prolyl-tRNA synthetase associated domain-containing protein [Candidatus Babeliaceae bacterium]|nr:prolyl-tRNA synthetase associated domain-containing protein [Candidatus Babeliaceae bacterium]
MADLVKEWENEKTVLDLLKAAQIEYTVFRHQPVFTTAERPVLIDSGDVVELPGLSSKNLFLKNTKNNTFFLVSVTQDKRVDLKALSKILGTARFSFGKPEELFELLRLQPGSVSPFGLIFDTDNKVSFVMDEDFLSATKIQFHPMRNDMSLVLSPTDFIAFMRQINHQPQIIRIPI